MTDPIARVRAGLASRGIATEHLTDAEVAAAVADFQTVLDMAGHGAAVLDSTVPSHRLTVRLLDLVAARRDLAITVVADHSDQLN